MTSLLSECFANEVNVFSSRRLVRKRQNRALETWVRVISQQYMASSFGIILCGVILMLLNNITPMRCRIEVVMDMYILTALDRFKCSNQMI